MTAWSGNRPGATFTREGEDSLEPRRCCGRHQTGQDRDRDPGSARLVYESQIVLGMEEQLGDRHCRTGDLLGEEGVDVLVRPLGQRMPVRESRNRHPHLLAGRRDRATAGGVSRRESRVLGSLGLHPVDELHELGGAPQVAEELVSLGRTVRRIDGLGHQITITYDSQVVDAGVTLVAGTTTDALNHTVTALSDAAGRTRVEIDALGNRSTMGSDANGNRVTWRDSNNIGMDCVFDARNRDVVCTDTAGAVIRRSYDANSNLIATTDALLKVETSQFDERNRKISTTDKILATTSFGYDPVSNLTRLTDAQGGSTEYVYDLRNLLVREVFPVGQTGRTARYYGYDPGRRLSSRAVVTIAAVGIPPATAPGSSEVTSYAYDAANRLTTRGYPDAQNDAFVYDHASRLLSAYSARYANQVTRAYDAASRLTSEALHLTSGPEAGVVLPVGYGYDVANRVTTITYPTGSPVTRDYTARNELFHVWDGAQVVSARSYDVGGRLIQNQAGNGLTETRSYVANDNLVADIRIPSVDHFVYSYDALKRKTAEVDLEVANQTQRFAYDDQSRLNDWKRTGTLPADPAVSAQTWTLSPVGDWNQTTVDGVTQNRTHTAVHELVDLNGTTLLYDAKGNLTRDDEGQTFTWDFENRLATAGNLQQGQGNSAAYAYDALGRRMKKSVTTAAVGPIAASTVPTYFVSAGAQEVVEITGDVTALNDATADSEDAGAAPFDPATGLGARGSLVADPAALRYNFQPPSTSTPDGWLADLGGASSGSGLGWSTATTGIDRDHLGRPLYDSFIPMGADTWQVPVSNGTHAVVIMCGDADSRAQTNTLWVNGTMIVDPTPYDGQVTNGYETGAFDGYAITVTVSNGLLSMSAGSGALDPKVNFIEIAPVGSTVDAATLARVQAAAMQATHDTSKAKAKTPPMVKRNVWGDYVDHLVSYTVAQPRHATKRLYTHANHLYSVAAVTSASGQVVERYSYTGYGAQTIKNSAGIVLAKSSVNSDRGFTGYKVDGESGLMYARARMYSEKLGRWITRDWDHVDFLSPTAGDGYVDGYNTYAAYYIPNDVDPTGFCCESEKISDSGGNKCCASDMKTVSMKNNTKHLVPHTFLSTPGLVLGYYPAWTHFPLSPGKTKNDTGHEFDNQIDYKLCPAALTQLQDAMRDDDGGIYTLFNMFYGHNCTSWACSQLKKVGIKPPISPWLPFIANPWLNNPGSNTPGFPYGGKLGGRK